MNDLEKQDDQILESDIVNIDVPDESETETPNFLAGVLRRWHIALLTFFVICLIGLPAIWLLIKPVYVVTGSIRIAPILEDILTSARDRGDISDYQSFMNTQVEMITSTQVVDRVADNLKDSNLSFFRVNSNGVISKIKQKLEGTQINREPAWILKQALFNGRIKVAAPRGKELIEISMKRSESAESIRIVNSFINAFMTVGVSYSTQEEDRNLGILRDQRKVINQEIEDLRQSIYMMAKEYGTEKLDSRQNLMMRRLESLNAELIQIEKGKNNLEAQIKLLERDSDDPIPPDEAMKMKMEYINGDNSVAKFEKEIADLEQTVIIAEKTLTPQHPDYILQTELLELYKKNLEHMKTEVGLEFDKILEEEKEKSNVAKLEKTRTSLKHLEEYELRLKEMITREDGDAIEIGRLGLEIQNKQEDLAMKKAWLDTILERIQDLELQQKRPARISVWRNADIVNVVDKRVKLTFGVILGGLACGAWLAFLRDRADKKLRLPEDAAKRIGIRVIGTTTSMYAVKSSLLPEQIIDDYQTIRANLSLINGHEIPHVLVVTSPSMREGKTTFSVNLATSLAEAGKKVLLIDGDLRKPDVGKLLNLPKDTKGIQDVLSGIPFEHAVQAITTSGLDVLAADFYDHSDGYELLAKPQTAERIRNISNKYDHVIIDTPPVLYFPDAMIWSKMANAAVLTSFAGQTTLPELKEANERMLKANAKVLGCIVSSVEAENSYYHHSAAYYAQNARARRARKKALLSFEKRKAKAK
ncbi:MAG: polysaccharide biosynthesis tyrosine autokinase [Sedimentisphaerales bacterium]|nr:polysaccharide biosynthesis tyrosine autokinase [Sedimentisphaerales bacterium]